MLRGAVTMIQAAFRLLNSWAEIERMVPRIERSIKDIERLWPDVQKTMEETLRVANDVRALAERIAPELIAPQRAVPQEQFPPTYDVRWLQTSLNMFIDADLTIDGVYGALTMEAVRRFQEQQGLAVDGWAGALTEAAIDNALRQRTV